MKYQQELFRQQTPYLQWLKDQQQQLSEKYSDKIFKGEQIEVLPFSLKEISLDSAPFETEFKRDIKDIEKDKLYAFVNRSGFLSDYALEVIQEYFLQYPEAVILYADEDYCGTLQELYEISEDGINKDILEEYVVCKAGEDKQLFRGNPWFKPDYSPDTLKSFFYFGSVFAIKGDEILESIEKNINLYELIISISTRALENKKQIVHIPKVLFTNENINDKDKLFGFNLPAIKDDKQDNTLVSIIIPSKDNSEIIKRCLLSLIENTKNVNYEVIIVDNGSSDEEKAIRDEFFDYLKNDKSIEITNIYQPQEFNFSRMCNIGANASNGEFLLFLNDDVEFFENEKWLQIMLLQAQNFYTGAVGAKLYYPKTEEAGYKIQHAGITNMGIGPAHKLGGLEDTVNIYHGHNTAVYNMLAVTAACLMIRKEYFDFVNGFDEELAVAYNDVELCFKLYENGLFNVVRNDVAIIHHESLTRGSDISKEKQQRLFNEKQLLYKKHPELFCNDPFYNKNLVQWKKETDYKVNYLFECDRAEEPQKLDLDAIKTLPYEYKNKLMRKIAGQNLYMVEIDSIEDEFIMDSTGEKKHCVIKGWSVVRNSDNSEFDRTLLLRSTKEDNTEIYSLQIYSQLRTDVETLFINEATSTLNTALSGIQVIFEQGKISQGEYQIGILMKKPSKRYIKWTDKTVEF